MQKLLYIILFFLYLSSNAQDSLDFIRIDLNLIENAGKLDPFFSKLSNSENNPINIVQIGDSHLQAGFMTEEFKSGLSYAFLGEDSIMAPGFIFPFTLAKTNNPSYYKVDYAGNWKHYRSVKKSDNSTYGISGITVSTDSVAQVKFQFNTKYSINHYAFDKVHILHKANPELKINTKGFSLKPSTEIGVTSLHCNELTDSFLIDINPGNGVFECYGLIFEKSGSEITYHTIGANGASADSYLRCKLFDKHLQLLNPDLVILSIGTNDAYSDDFEPDYTFGYYSKLLQQIKSNMPNASIIINTSGDFVNSNKKTSQNNILLREKILIYALQHDLPVWDFFEIMGGAGSIESWSKAKLGARDRIHLTKQGYIVKGLLFFDAFEKAFDDYYQKHN